jgi:putative chitinase
MILKRGDTGDAVKLLQEKLGVEPIGKFGPKTEDAVKLFQKANGLAQDGVVNENTWNLINKKPAAQMESKVNNSKINLDKLKNHLPDKVISQIPGVMDKFKIDTPLRLSHFLSQCSHESGNFALVKENLNYSKKGLLSIFKKYFPTEKKAELYERKPEKIANLVYGNRMGNGDEASGEGYRYCGRGYIQLTGKDNYKAFDAMVEDDIIANPELVATKYPLLSAAWFFSKNGINSISDKGATDAVVTEVTKRVNGGSIGIEDRKKHFKEYYKLLS